MVVGGRDGLVKGRTRLVFIGGVDDSMVDREKTSLGILCLVCALGAQVSRPETDSSHQRYLEKAKNSTSQTINSSRRVGVGSRCGVEGMKIWSLY